MNGATYLMYLTRTAGIETTLGSAYSPSYPQCILPALRELKRVLEIVYLPGGNICILPALRELKLISSVAIT